MISGIVYFREIILESFNTVNPQASTPIQAKANFWAIWVVMLSVAFLCFTHQKSAYKYLSDNIAHLSAVYCQSSSGTKIVLGRFIHVWKLRIIYQIEYDR